jgi:uncharacterized membrane protein
MIKTILGWSLLAALGAVLFVNALFMLASPRAWFRLPHWIRAQGSLTEQRYANGWGGIQVRSAGAILLAFIAWVVYHSFIQGTLPKEREMVAILSIMLWCIVAVVVVHMVINAAFLLASPRAWFRLPGWLRVQGPLTKQKHASGWGGLLARLAGALMLAAIVWVLYNLLNRR